MTTRPPATPPPPSAPFWNVWVAAARCPVGAYAQSSAELMLLTVFLGTPDGQQTFQAKVRGLTHDPHQLAGDAHLALVERGGGSCWRRRGGR